MSEDLGFFSGRLETELSGGGEPMCKAPGEKQTFLLIMWASERQKNSF